MSTATASSSPKTKLSGHAAHTQTADQQEGLGGSFSRPINVTFIGAGSGFCPVLCRDVLLTPGADHGELRLVDTDTGRLKMTHQVISKLIVDTGRSDGWTVTASSDRRTVLRGTTYAICCVEVSGLACVAWDNDIPLKYGVDQCIGDTIGPGGLFKGLRTVPVFLDILRDMRDLCPDAIMLNYTNPMGIMCLAAARAVPEISVVGLCHSVQGTSHLLADYAGIPLAEMEWECAGINHLAWFTKLSHNGQNLYTTKLYDQFATDIEAAIAEADAGRASFDSRDERLSHNPAGGPDLRDLVRKDMCVQFGAFITESSGHLSEYLPYYRKNAGGKKLLRRAYDGGSRFYASNWPNWRKNAEEGRARLATGEETIELKRSWEYASWIIEAREKDSPFRIHGNVMNNSERPGARGSGEGGKLITNLPGDGCVEVACMVDRNGIHPTRYGALPPQMAAICNGNMSFIGLAAQACIDRSKEAATYAMLLDPMTAAVLSPREIRAMTNELFDAEKAFLPGYK